MPYEKVGKEVKCIADEVPFEIPDSWQWVRLGNIGNWGSGATPSRTNAAFYGGEIPWLKTGDLNDSYIKDIPESITQSALEKTSVKLNPIGSILIAMYGATIGKLGILTIPATTNQACCACLPFCEVYNKYLFYFLMAHKESFIKKGEGGAQPNISKEKIVETLIPLPPLEEQKRIVAKIEELMPYIEEYNKVETKNNELNITFPDKLKKSILQDAVQGKLVPQNNNDEPASVLIEKIRKEKAQLIKDKKIKKDKNESYIFRRDNSHYEILNGKENCIDDLLPFEIPDSWQWVRLKSLCIINPRNQANDDIDAGFIPMTLIKEGYVNKHSFEIKKWKEIKNGFTHFANGDIVIAKITPCFQNRKSAIIKNLPNNIGAGTTELHVIRNLINSSLNLQYLFLLFKTEMFISNGVKNFTGTAGQQRIGKSYIEEYFVPLPPLNEQQRIVVKVEELLPKIERLTK
ncbi:MAG: restriction endonuclease subunit S [Clostridiaceae bacterium]|nr:restriction endonuclease subunit S [Clostridiaceae bacterium]